jgi:cytidylate kinase
MKAIRGATTVSLDSPEEIKQNVATLLNTIKERNGLHYEQIICIMFSTTDDIHSFYPAKAAREAGFSSCPLYSSLEPSIEDSLKLCIRVMMLADIDFAPRHVYLNGAKVLRKDLSENINIALDGPAGSGKSTVSKLIAQKLDILYLDTGAMYRAVALKCIRENIDYANSHEVETIINKLDLKVEYKDARQMTLLDGVDVGDEIRTPAVSMLSSYISTYSFVRKKMVDLQRRIANNMSCILDGRDIGTNVLPNCRFKFFITASPEVRAKRRYDEDVLKGGKQTYEEVLKQINERDHQDKNRAVAPLKCADDAVLIDTSNLSIEQVVNTILSKIQEKI